jgi:hypothetical protein
VVDTHPERLAHRMDEKTLAADLIRRVDAVLPVSGDVD